MKLWRLGVTVRCVVISLFDDWVAARRIEFCRNGVLSPTGQLCCSEQCGPRCGKARCASIIDRCCWRRRRPYCDSINAVDCFVKNATLLTDEHTPWFQDGCGSVRRPCVALLLTGHMRTFEQTKKSIIRHLLRANLKECDFDLIVATYLNQDAAKPRINDKSTHSTSVDSVVSWQLLYAAFQEFNAWRATRFHVFREDEIGAILPRNIRRQSPAIARIKKPEHLEQVNRIKRALALVQQGVLMVQDLERRRKRPYDVIVRLRPDIELLRPLMVNAAILKLVGFNVLVVPATYDARGGLQIRASQLVTRPCAKNGTLRPRWSV